MSATELAIDVARLTKIYRIYARPQDRLREAILRRSRHREFRALDDVSFTVAPGEALGLIGENGAGKSTLLKILAGVVEPTTGSSRVQGRIAGILELGSGFHPEFSGRENAILNAALLGLSADEVRQRLPEILEWSELGGFVDQPVKHYSTGMAMRLGFSIATQVEPDILIIDEALSVGDGYFQKKCMDRLQALVARGTTLLFCSHAMYYISAFCRRALWLRHGEVAALGPSADVIREYENYLLAKSPVAEPGSRPGELGSGPARITAVTRIREGSDTGAYRPDEAFELEIEWESQEVGLAFHLGVGVDRVDGVQVLSFVSRRSGASAWRNRNHYCARLVVPALPLINGCFTIYVFLLDEKALHVFDRRILPGALTIESSEFTIGLVRAEHRWLDEGAADGVDRPASLLAEA